MAVRTKARKSSSKKTTAGGALKSVAKAGVSALMGGKGEGKRKKSRSVQWWANRVLKAKLQKKYNRIKYGGI